VDTLRAQLRQGIVGAGWAGASVAILLAAGVYATSRGYALLNHGPNILFLRTPLDQAIPVAKVFVIPYVSLMPLTYLTLVLLLVFRVRVYQSAALAMIVTFLISYAFYFFLQSYVQRPVVGGEDALARMLRDVYSSDQPYNDFPSLHTSLSTILAIHWVRVDRRIGWLVAFWAALIVMSTVFVHQHYLADVFGGLLIAFGVSTLTLRYVVDRPGRGRPQKRAANTADNDGSADAWNLS
jgi:membrane-associated phospholipid phosphatase